MPDCPVLLAQKILLQLAARNIGQLTDINHRPVPWPRRGRAPTVRPADGDDRVRHGYPGPQDAVRMIGLE